MKLALFNLKLATFDSPLYSIKLTSGSLLRDPSDLPEMPG